ncbi:MAG: hypothetical protein JO039_10035 [Solirubrobacterales bacterium]|nr:hypothetical protein [Solirubrobacterales bacterium]
MRRFALIALCTSLVAGCSVAPPEASPTELHAAMRESPSRTATVSTPIRQSCQYRDFPDGAIGADPRCTPGVLNPAAAANPRKTICRRGYETELAKREAAARALKIAMMVRYGSTGNPSTYVVAERVPAEDGGSPTDPKNLWPMPLYGWGGALTESAVANSLHDQICQDAVTVREATRVLEGDWLKRGIPDDD